MVLKKVYSASFLGHCPLLSIDNLSLIADKDKILERWTEYLNSVLNSPSSINEEAISHWMW